MLADRTHEALEDVEFLSRSEHRITTLDVVARRPMTRSGLQDATGASPSTVSRTLREFEARHWVRREGNQYEATELGAFVASGMRDLLDRLETERKLRDVWTWLPTEVDGFSIEMAVDAVVTRAVAGDPYRPINRFVSLLQETDRFRFVGPDLALLEPCRDEFRRRILDGLHAEIIDPPRVARYVLSTYPEHCTPSLESGNLTILLHDDLPTYGVSLFDRRIGISCYNPTTGTVQAFIDTDSPDAREWGEAMYASVREEAWPIADNPTTIESM